MTKVNQEYTANTTTPESFREITTVVAEGLAESLGNPQVYIVDPGEQGVKLPAGMVVNVLVNGAYFCRGEPPEFLCALSMRTHLTFRTIGTGKIIGKKHILVGQAWYGKHPVEMDSDPAVDAGQPSLQEAIDKKIKLEIPPTVVLPPLASATEDGLSVFIEEVRAEGG